MMMSARLSARSTAKMNAEKRLVRQRDREDAYRTSWGNQVQYYKTWEKNNNQYEDWTSPRYYDTNNQTIEANKKKHEHQTSLQQRRQKLLTLFEEEKRSHRIEMMVKNRHSYERATISSETLKDIHTGLKIAEEDRKKHEAEIALYHHWRNNNPVVREHERALTKKNLKLSWLDQQVEKRIEKEKAEEECRKILAERNKRIEEENTKDEELKRETAEKNQQRKSDLEKQMQELRLKQKQSDELRRNEQEHNKKLAQLSDLLQHEKEIKRQVIERELALENLKQHKMKLKQKAIDVRNTLEQERDFVKKLIEVDFMNKMADEAKKLEIQTALQEFLKFTRDQHELERKRERHFNFIFDSEAKDIYEKQREIWLAEQASRSALLTDVLNSIQQQIEEKVRVNKEKQRETLEERQNIVKLVEEYNRDVNQVKLDEDRKRQEWKKGIEEQIQEKRALATEAKMKEEKQLDLELEAARKEEERIRQEIMKLQQRCGPIRPSRSQIFL